jgi:hypothetical protein
MFMCSSDSACVPSHAAGLRTISPDEIEIQYADLTRYNAQITT